MPSGYEKSADYGGPTPSPWYWLPMIVAVAGVAIWLLRY